MASFLAAWRERSAWKRTRVEGQHLVKEARRILKRRGRDLSEEVVAGIKGAIADVETALAGTDQEDARRAISALDERMDQSLAGARKSTLREYSESIGVAIAIALVLRAFVVEAFQIPSGSMIPTLEVGDHIFVSKFAYGLGIPFTNVKILELNQPERGDVIVFKYPIDPSTDYIKRVVGLPGDRLEYRNKRLTINGRLVPVRQIDDYLSRERMQFSRRYIETLDGVEHEILLEDDAPAAVLPSRAAAGNCNYNMNGLACTVPPGHYFVMGDNRDNSSDSRVWGFVPDQNIVGKAFFIWLNLNELGRFGSFR